jgi:colanic acid/amylovoran biosynthesis glycosyltransferase
MNLAIISTNNNKYSETFIRNQVDLLPYKIFYLFDGYLPKQFSTDKGKTSSYFIHTWVQKLGLTIKNKPDSKKRLEQAIIHYLQKNNIRLLLCQYGPSGVELMPIALATKIPMLVYFHGYDAYRNDILNSYGKGYKELFKVAEKIIVVSKDMRKQLITLGCPEEKLNYLVYGVNTEKFKTSELKAKKYFVYCGRFVEKKSPQTIIQAFHHFYEQNKDYTLVMIGDGPLLEECKHLRKKLNLENFITFTGAISTEKIIAIYQEAVCFLQHSVISTTNDSEGTPVSILEAMSFGLPVIATKHGGITDIITDTVTGFLINEHDINGMVKKMQDVVNNSDQIKEIVLDARQYVVKNHGVKNYIYSLTQLIHQVVNP